jgi:hypothetical protein
MRRTDVEELFQEVGARPSQSRATIWPAGSSFTPKLRTA